MHYNFLLCMLSAQAHSPILRDGHVRGASALARNSRHSRFQFPSAPTSDSDELEQDSAEASGTLALAYHPASSSSRQAGGAAF